MKKLFAFLILIFLFGAQTILFAEPPDPDPPFNDRPTQQRPVSESTIVVDPQRSGGNAYNLSFMWSRPEPSMVTDGNLSVEWLRLAAQGGFWTNFPTRYEIRMRNATANENFGANPNLRTFYVNAPADGQARTRLPGTRLEVTAPPDTYQMNHSSLYEININPQKPIPVLNPNTLPDAPPTLSSAFARIDNSPGLPVGRDLLFLTDIEVNVQGRNNTLTITWRDPSWGGVNVFNHWQISRARYPIAPGASAWFTYPVLPVNGPAMGPGSIVRNADGTLTATIVDPQLRAIGQYAVRVEPLLGANPGSATHAVRRNLDGSPQERSEISINNRHFNLHFTQNDYTNNVTMVPQLNIEQAGVQFLRLWWPHLTALEHEIAWVEIEEWPPEMGGQIPQSNMGRLGTIATYADEAFLRNNDVFIGPGIPSERRGFALAIRMRDGTEIRTEIVVFDPLIADFAPYRPEVTALDHVGNGVLAMEWLAFARFPAVPAEMPLVPDGNPYRGRFVDTALIYEIYASDSWEDMERMTVPLMTIDPRQLEAGRRVSPVQPEPFPIIYDPTWALFPSNRITHFQSLTDDGIKIENIRGNKV
ncbi:MAG: hypothetical protein FWD19_02870, partial [Defluviitaleaceae bacterium]|nr:hypothetical protein [Defluviitaleaceae bacterium]